MVRCLLSLTQEDKHEYETRWFSLALGAAELITPRKLNKALGVRGRQGLTRTFRAREILADAKPLFRHRDTEVTEKERQRNRLCALCASVVNSISAQPLSRRSLHPIT